jgi:hypothetical protein
VGLSHQVPRNERQCGYYASYFYSVGPMGGVGFLVDCEHFFHKPWYIDAKLLIPF